MAYGVVRSDNQGVPKYIEKRSAINKNELEKVIVTLKTAHIKGDDKIKGLVALSLYD